MRKIVKFVVHPHDVHDYSRTMEKRINSRLKSQLKIMKRMAREKHWAYDFNLHLTLLEMKNENDPYFGREQ